MDVGFLGLGMMGTGMARNLVKAGHGVRVWNRTRSAVDAIEGATAVASPRDAFDADVVLTMLADDQAIRDVVLAGDPLSGARKGVVHACTATISVAFAEELRAAHERAGIDYVSAPVFGRPDVAAAGQLNVVVGGKPAAIAKAQPVFDAIGKKTWNMGEDPRQANAAKIAGNMMITQALEAMAEAVTLGEANGVSRKDFLDLITNTLFGCRVYESYGAKIANSEYEPGFKMALGLKDLRLATALAESANKRLPALDAVRGRMQAAVEAGLGDRDWSAIADRPFDAK